MFLIIGIVLLSSETSVNQFWNMRFMDFHHLVALIFALKIRMWISIVSCKVIVKFSCVILKNEPHANGSFSAISSMKLIILCAS